MNYTIEPLDVNEKKVEDGLRSLFKAAFNMPELPEEGSLPGNVNTKAANPSFFLSAVENGTIIGCSAMIAIDFFINDRTYTCYQSCWGAVHPDHQGKKIFVNILKYAKEYLKEKGAGMIFGVGNDNSHPIFINNLDFDVTPLVILRIPNIPFMRNRYFNDSAADYINQHKSTTLFVKEEQVMILKQQENREPVEVVRINESFAWGKIKKVKKYGITLHYFYIGGVFLNDPMDYKHIINKIFSHYRVAYVQIVSGEFNSWNRMLKGWKKASINGVIHYDLNVGPVTNSNMMYGIINVF